MTPNVRIVADYEIYDDKIIHNQSVYGDDDTYSEVLTQEKVFSLLAQLENAIEAVNTFIEKNIQEPAAGKVQRFQKFKSGWYPIPFGVGHKPINIVFIGSDSTQSLFRICTKSNEWNLAVTNEQEIEIHKK